MDQIPRDLDWVTKRANCVAFKVFQQLKVDIEKDIEVRNSLVPIQQRTTHNIGFSLETNDNVIFSVHRSGANIVSLIQFRMDGENIVVRDNKDRTILTASLTLNNAGECVLGVDSSELTSWQFRRRALEQLFFGFSIL
jgi:hypothetical protein